METPGFGDLSFSNGVAQSKDDPASAGPDWETKIEKDFIFSPKPKVDFRFIQLQRNHLTGPGSTQPMLVFGCKNKVLTVVYANENAVIKKITKSSIQLQTFAEDPSTGALKSGLDVTLKYNARKKSLIANIKLNKEKN